VIEQPILRAMTNAHSGATQPWPGFN